MILLFIQYLIGNREPFIVNRLEDRHSFSLLLYEIDSGYGRQSNGVHYRVVLQIWEILLNSDENLDKNTRNISHIREINIKLLDRVSLSAG